MTDTKPTPGALPQAWRDIPGGWTRHGTLCECASDLEAALADVVQPMNAIISKMLSNASDLDAMSDDHNAKVAAKWIVKWAEDLATIRAALAPKE